MFNPENNELLEIKPVEDIVELPEEIEKPPTPPTPIPQNEIFKTEKHTKNVELEIEEGVKTDEELNGWGKPKKRGIGKRGKDKKPRVKRPATAKQLQHLAKMRQKAAQKRTAIALEKKRKKEEIKKEMERKERKKVSFATQANVVKNAIIKPKIHKYSNNPRASKTNEADFFALMDRYELYKNAKNVKIQKEKSLQERLMEQRKNKPHPNRRIPALQRPVPPTDIYADIFNYKGRI